MTSLTTKPKLDIKLTSVLKTVLYAGLAGEMVKTLGMTDDGQIAAIQQAVSEGLISEVIVTATRPDGRRETMRLEMKPPATGASVNLALEPGKSLLESLDVSLAAAVAYQAELLRRQGLRPEFYVSWSARALANPAQLRATATRLNLHSEPFITPPGLNPETGEPLYEPTPPPPPPPPRRYPQTVNTYKGFAPPPPAYKPVTVAVITPAKDPDVRLTIETTRKR